MTPRCFGRSAHVKAQLVITAVVIRPAAKRRRPRYGLSRYWVHQLVKRRNQARPPRSTLDGPTPAPRRRPDVGIIQLRKTLAKTGYDGAATIADTCAAPRPSPGQLSTIWRILDRRGFPTNAPVPAGTLRSRPPQPMLASDVTPTGASPTPPAPKSSNIIDDHSRLLIASIARRTITGPDVVETFTDAFTTSPQRRSPTTARSSPPTRRAPPCVLLGELGGSIAHGPRRQNRTPTPNPQKTSRRAPATTIDELRHHQRLLHHPTTPAFTGALTEAFNARPKETFPPAIKSRCATDAAGHITIRYNSQLHRIGLSKHLRRTKVIVLINDLDIRVLDRHTDNSSANSHSTHPRLPKRGVKPGNSPTNRPPDVNDVPRHLSTVSRDIPHWCPGRIRTRDTGFGESRHPPELRGRDRLAAYRAGNRAPLRAQAAHPLAGSVGPAERDQHAVTAGGALLG